MSYDGNHFKAKLKEDLKGMSVSQLQRKVQEVDTELLKAETDNRHGTKRTNYHSSDKKANYNFKKLRYTKALILTILNIKLKRS